MTWMKRLCGLYDCSSYKLKTMDDELVVPPSVAAITPMPVEVVVVVATGTQNYVVDYPNQYFNFHTFKASHPKSWSNKFRLLLKSKREFLNDLSAKVDEGRDIQHEIGFLFGSMLGTKLLKLLERRMKRDSKVAVEEGDGRQRVRVQYNSWEEEFADRRFVLVYNGFDKEGLDKIRSELMARSLQVNDKHNKDNKGDKGRKRIRKIFAGRPCFVVSWKESILFNVRKVTNKGSN